MTWGHDVRAAIVRGYVKRCREAAEAAYSNGRGWASPEIINDPVPFEKSPYDHIKRNKRSGFSMALSELIDAARNDGMEREAIEGCLAMYVVPVNNPFDAESVNRWWEQNERHRKNRLSA